MQISIYLLRDRFKYYIYYISFYKLKSVIYCLPPIHEHYMLNLIVIKLTSR